MHAPPVPLWFQAKHIFKIMYHILGKYFMMWYENISTGKKPKQMKGCVQHCHCATVCSLTVLLRNTWNVSKINFILCNYKWIALQLVWQWCQVQPICDWSTTSNTDGVTVCLPVLCIIGESLKAFMWQQLSFIPRICLMMIQWQCLQDNMLPSFFQLLAQSLCRCSRLSGYFDRSWTWWSNIQAWIEKGISGTL
jgi:hypothetical protein